MSHKNEYEIEDDGSVEERECSICQDVPERVIHLSCEHIVCLECATKMIFADKDMNDVDLTEIQCEVCNEITPLSEEVQESIIEFLNEGLQNQDQGDSEQDQSEIEEQDSEISENQEENVSQNQDSCQDEEIEQQDNEQDDLSQDQTDRTDHRDISHIDEQYESQENETDYDIKCKNHISESCIYYDADEFKMYCAQCLIQEKTKPSTVKGLKSIKKGYQEILQNFQDLVTQINLKKDLLNNKKKDLKLRRKNCQEQTDSQKKKLLISYEQIYDLIEENKQKMIKNFDFKSKEIMKDLHKNENDVDQKLNYLKKVIENIENIQDNEETAIQDTIQYYFDNFKVLQENLKDNFVSPQQNLNEIYQRFKEKVEQLKEQYLQDSYQLIIQNIKKKLDVKKCVQFSQKSQQENIQPQQTELLKKWRIEHERILKQKENVQQLQTNFNLIENNKLAQRYQRSRTPKCSYDFQQKFQDWKKTPLNIQHPNKCNNIVKYKRKTFKQVEQKLGDFKLSKYQHRTSLTSHNFFQKQQGIQLNNRKNLQCYNSKRSSSNLLFKFIK